MAIPNKFELYGKYYNKEDSLSFKLDRELLISVLKDITLNLEEISKESSKIVEVEESFETLSWFLNDLLEFYSLCPETGGGLLSLDDALSVYPQGITFVARTG